MLLCRCGGGLQTLTYAEFRRHVGKAGLTLGEFAQLLRMNRSSISNLAAREAVPAHLAIIAALLGELAEKQVDFRPVLAALDFAPKRPRGAHSFRGLSDTPPGANDGPERAKNLGTLDRTK